MTHLSQVPYIAVAAFFNQVFTQMSHTGVTVEQLENLAATPEKIAQWVQLLPEILPSPGEVSIAELFPNDTTLVNLLIREDITTLGELADCTADEVQTMWQLGPSKFKKLTEALETHGLQYSEDIDNGARRVSYGGLYGKHTIRRDRIGRKPISSFIHIHPDPGRSQDERMRMTIDEFQTADTETLRRLFSVAEGNQISDWIRTNVR